MSIDRLVCETLLEHWRELDDRSFPPASLEFMKVQGKLTKNASIIALLFDSGSQQPVAVAKIPRNPACPTAVKKEYDAMIAMQRSLSGWDGLARITCSGFISEVAGTPVLFQQAAVGHSLVRDMTSREAEEEAYGSILPWLLDFHAYESAEITLEGGNISRLIVDPVEKFKTEIRNYPEIEVPGSLTGYLDELPQRVAGAKLRLCRQHGDFNAHNIIVSGDRLGFNDFRVIDWEDYTNEDLPVHDLNHFFISNSKLIDMSASAEKAFEKFILEAGWYQDLYAETVKKYEARDICRADVFWSLTPLYMTGMCLRLMDEHRQQQNTLGTWIQRATRFVERFPLLER